MKDLDQWLREDSVSHQNKANMVIHYVRVPLIFFSIVVLLMSFPGEILEGILPWEVPLLENWAFVALVPVLVFCFRVSVPVLLFSLLCIGGNHLLAMAAPLWLVCLIIFAAAWARQFYKLQIERKKTSFLKDLHYLLIGPDRVIQNLFR